MKRDTFKIAAVLLIAVAVLTGCAGWERVFKVKYVPDEGEKYVLEITNTTNRTFRNVIVVYKHARVNNWNIEYPVGSFEPGETKTVAINQNYVRNKLGLNHLSIFDYELKRIKY